MQAFNSEKLINPFGVECRRGREKVNAMVADAPAPDALATQGAKAATAMALVMQDNQGWLLLSHFSPFR